MRRRVDGWLVVDKPAGISSAGVVNRVKWAFNAEKAGHSGTLDPDATGVLAIALGEATKTIPLLEDVLKAYRFIVRWGQATNTDDAAGETIATSNLRPSAADIRAALPGFTGDILQVPPQFSAVKVDGERAYARARAGEAMELASRPLHVTSLILAEQPDADHAVLDMVCGKGGYVRSVARDLGQRLGCLGHVLSLRRLWTGPFTLDQAVTLDRFEERTAGLEALLLPVKAGLSGLEERACDPGQAAQLRNGAKIAMSGTGPCWVSLAGEPVAIGESTGGWFQPSRIFNP